MIDFIVDLPSSNGFINIIVIVNRLIKMRYMIPIDLINAILIAKCFVKYVFIQLGCPTTEELYINLSILNRKVLEFGTTIFC